MEVFSAAFSEGGGSVSYGSGYSDKFTDIQNMTGLFPCLWRTYSNGVFGDNKLVRLNWGITRTCPYCLQRELDLVYMTDRSEDSEVKESYTVTKYVAFLKIDSKVVPTLFSISEATALWTTFTSIYGIPSGKFEGIDKTFKVDATKDGYRFVPKGNCEKFVVQKDDLISLSNLIDLFLDGKIYSLSSIIDKFGHIQPLWFEANKRGLFIPLYFHKADYIPIFSWNIIKKYYDKYGVDLEALSLMSEEIHNDLGVN